MAIVSLFLLLFFFSQSQILSGKVQARSFFCNVNESVARKRGILPRKKSWRLDITDNSLRKKTLKIPTSFRGPFTFFKMADESIDGHFRNLRGEGSGMLVDSPRGVNQELWCHLGDQDEIPLFRGFWLSWLS